MTIDISKTAVEQWIAIFRKNGPTIPADILSALSARVEELETIVRHAIADGWKEAADELTKRVDEINRNAGEIRKFQETYSEPDNRDEARCRELGASYVSEMAWVFNRRANEYARSALTPQTEVKDDQA